MPLDELSPTDAWPEIDRRLLDGPLPAPAPFPLELLPDKWRAWVEATAQSFIPADYAAQAAFAAMSAVCGAGTMVVVTSTWSEPMVLWQALIGGTASGKSPALAAASQLIGKVKSTPGSRGVTAPAVLPDGSLEQLGTRMTRNMAGITLCREELADWLAAARQRDVRAGWLAGWSAGGVMGKRRPGRTTMHEPRFPLGLMGTVTPNRLTDAFGSDDGFAERFLYAWPDPVTHPTLAGHAADTDGIVGMLQRIASVGGTIDDPAVQAFNPQAMACLQQLLPELRRQMNDAAEIEAAWIGKGAGTIVRLAAMLALMDWAQDPDNPLDGDATPKHVEAAHALWSGYFLPHARRVFESIGGDEHDRLTRRVVRWLRRTHCSEVSRERIRRDALCQSVNAAGAEDVIARLEAGGVLRPVSIDTNGPGRRPRRWAVNPGVR